MDIEKGRKRLNEVEGVKTSLYRSGEGFFLFVYAVTLGPWSVINCTELLDLVLLKIVGPGLEGTGVEYCSLMKLHAEDLYVDASE